MAEAPRGLAVLVASLVAIAVGCGGGGSHKTASVRTATGTSTRPPAPTTSPSGRTTTALTPNPKRASVEQAVAEFVAFFERSDAVGVCRFLGRPPGSLEGCARAAGIDLHAVPSSDEMSVTRIAFKGSHASAKLAGGQTFTLRSAHGRWLITGLRP